MMVNNYERKECDVDKIKSIFYIVTLCAAIGSFICSLGSVVAIFIFVLVQVWSKVITGEYNLSIDVFIALAVTGFITAITTSILCRIAEELE